MAKIKERWQAVAFPLELIKLGYDAKGNRWRVNPRRHLLRIEGNTPAIDSRALRYWYNNGVRQISVYLTDGRVLVATMRDFVTEARAIQYAGQGKQYVAPNVWRTVNVA